MLARRGSDNQTLFFHFILNFIDRFAFKPMQSHQTAVPITRAPGSLCRALMTYCRR